MCPQGSAHDHHPGGILVQSVHDPGAGQLDEAGVVVQQGIQERAFGITGAGMHDQPGRLIDDQYFVIFINDRKRDRHWLRCKHRRLRTTQFDVFTPMHGLPGFGRYRVDQDAGVQQPRFQQAARVVREDVREGLIQAHAGECLRNTGCHCCRLLPFICGQFALAPYFHLQSQNPLITASPTMRQLILFIFIIATSLNAGCSLFSSKSDDRDSGSDADKWSQQKLYKEARDAVKDGTWNKAVEYYEKLQARHPFGEHSQQAQLDLAYAYYKQDEPGSAVAACDRFIKLNPNHPHVDYAYYMKGLANFSQGKGLTERFLPIDASQRDQAAAMKSFEDFEELTKRFPRSQYMPDAQKRMMYLRNILAQHEVHVANYYMRRGAFVAAANRARYVVENYGRSPAVPEALVIMAKAYRILELDELSEDALRVLQTNFPAHPGLQEVRKVTLR